MKKRLSLVANFFALNLLFFALYLNFVKEDNNNAVSAYKEHPTSLVNETVLLQNSVPYEPRHVARKATGQPSQKENTSSAPLTLSFN